MGGLSNFSVIKCNIQLKNAGSKLIHISVSFCGKL